MHKVGGDSVKLARVRAFWCIHRGGSRTFLIVGLNARMGGKYWKPHLLISADHTQIIKQLVVRKTITGRGKNKCFYS